jgi:hypothetical protein
VPQRSRRWMIFAILVSALAPARRVDVIGATEEARKPVILTNQLPAGSFPVAPEILASKPPILFLSITRVVNPDMTPFEISVHLLPENKNGVSRPRVLVGNFSLYPPDKPGGFQLSAADAFRTLEYGGKEQTEVRLLVEIQRIHETKPWTPIEVTISPPVWRSSQS